LPYFLVLPLAEYRFRESLSADVRDRVSVHVAGALSVDEVRGVDSLDEGRLECGVLTVDRSEIVLAVWTGDPAVGRGGVGDVVEYARALERPLIWIDPSTGSVKTERLPTPQPGASTAGAPVAAVVPSLEMVQRYYSELDATAERHAPTTRRLVLQIIWLHLIGAAVGFTSGALNLSGIIGKSLTLFKLVTLSLALYLSFKQKKAHRQWKGARLAAEICRSFIAIWPMRRREARFVTIATGEQSDLVRNLKAAWYLDRQAELPLEGARERYISGRVRDQLDYFDRKYKTDKQRATRLRAVALGATVAAVACSGLALAMSLSDISGASYDAAKWLSDIIGLVPPAVLTLVLGHDLGYRSRRVGDVTENLERAERRLRLALTWPSLWREVAETEDLLMREVAEWYSQAAPGKKK
jgi:hypothetical protein